MWNIIVRMPTINEAVVFRVLASSWVLQIGIPGNWMYAFDWPFRSFSHVALTGSRTRAKGFGNECRPS